MLKLKELIFKYFKLLASFAAEKKLASAALHDKKSVCEYNVNYNLNTIWCITDVFGIINVKQANTSLHTISLLAFLQYFLHPHLSRKEQAFEAAVKVVQTGKHLESVTCQSR